ncbi:MAG: sigma-70 family RNA polymerase sigma factor [Desulfopila sp.]
MSTAKNHQLSAPETWVDRYSDSLFSYALYRVSSQAVAEEMVQETFVAALSARKNFHGNASEKTWLFGILKHKIMDHYRNAYKNTAVSEETMESLASDIFDEHGNWHAKPAKWRNTPDLAYEQNEFLIVLQQCLDKMSKRAAAVFRLREIVQIETEEICEALGITPTNYWVIMHRARLHTRKCLESNWFTE